MLIFTQDCDIIYAELQLLFMLRAITKLRNYYMLGGIRLPRAKKDGKYINIYAERELVERLTAYAAEKGQTITTALERIIKQHLDENDLNKKQTK